MDGTNGVSPTSPGADDSQSIGKLQKSEGKLQSRTVTSESSDPLQLDPSQVQQAMTPSTKKGLDKHSGTKINKEDLKAQDTEADSEQEHPALKADAIKAGVFEGFNDTSYPQETEEEPTADAPFGGSAFLASFLSGSDESDSVDQEPSEMFGGSSFLASFLGAASETIEGDEGIEGSADTDEGANIRNEEKDSAVDFEKYLGSGSVDREEKISELDIGEILEFRDIYIDENGDIDSQSQSNSVRQNIPEEKRCAKLLQMRNGQMKLVIKKEYADRASDIQSHLVHNHGINLEKSSSIFVNSEQWAVLHTLTISWAKSLENIADQTGKKTEEENEASGEKEKERALPTNQTALPIEPGTVSRTDDKKNADTFEILGNNPRILALLEIAKEETKKYSDKLRDSQSTESQKKVTLEEEEKAQNRVETQKLEANPRIQFRHLSEPTLSSLGKIAAGV